MDLLRINFSPIVDGGDDVTTALRKSDLNFRTLNAAMAPGGEVANRVEALESTVAQLGGAARKDVGMVAGTVAAGDDARFLSIGTTAGTVAAGDDPRLRPVGMTAGSVAAGDDPRFASNASAAAAAQSTANSALPRSGGSVTGAISAKLGGVVAFGTTGSATIGGQVYSDFFQNTIADVSGNIFMRLQCVDVTGGVTYSSLVTSHYDGSNATYRFQHNGVAQASTWQSTSDARIKRNLVALSDPLGKIDAIVGYQFYEKRVMGNSTDAEGRPVPAQYTSTCGVLAQDVMKVLPAAVDDLGAGIDTNEQPIEGMLGVNDAGLSALFVECIKALKAENVELAARLSKLETRPAA